MSVAFKNISLSYKEKVILEDISFCISRGELLGIVGPNGSGKTTLMKLVAGDFMPSKGVIKYDNKVITCDNLDLEIKTNYAIAYNNVEINDDNSVMKAQVVRLNILTKDIEINSQDKIKIITN